ncbi:hypothetical protein [Nannocystis exedens]|uniref:hypothetical protein n=1 Tax=Nannocystis exedens TaxID=54 RepID=UPI00116076AD|nr:hypothetical protein [Nannocystis exedens]
MSSTLVEVVEPLEVELDPLSPLPVLDEPVLPELVELGVTVVTLGPLEKPVMLAVSPQPSGAASMAVARVTRRSAAAGERGRCRGRMVLSVAQVGAGI